MEELDFEVIDDLQAQMSRCAALSLQFVLGGDADNVLDEARKVLDSMEISTEDRLLGVLFG